jgi:hypothetical protein
MMVSLCSKPGDANNSQSLHQFVLNEIYMKLFRVVILTVTCMFVHIESSKKYLTVLFS